MMPWTSNDQPTKRELDQLDKDEWEAKNLCTLCGDNSRTYIVSLVRLCEKCASKVFIEALACFGDIFDDVNLEAQSVKTAEQAFDSAMEAFK